MTKRRDVCHLGLLPQPRQFSWKKQLVLLYGTQLLSHWSLCSEEDSAGSFLPQSLVCSTVHKLPAALTPDMCNPHVSTQTPSSSCLLEGTSWGRESLIVSLGSRQQVLQVWWEIFLKMKPELLCLQQYNNFEWCWETPASPPSCQELREHCCVSWTAYFFKLCTVHFSHSCRRWVPRSTMIFWGDEKSFR